MVPSDTLIWREVPAGFLRTDRKVTKSLTLNESILIIMNFSKTLDLSGKIYIWLFGEIIPDLKVKGYQSPLVWSFPGIKVIPKKLKKKKKVAISHWKTAEIFFPESQIVWKIFFFYFFKLKTQGFSYSFIQFFIVI